MMFFGIPGLMVWLGSTLNIALWVKMPMAAMCSRPDVNLILFSIEYNQVHDLYV